MNDLKQDVVNHKEMFKNSEDKRGELQVHIEQTSIKIKTDTSEHANYQNELINENEKLKSEIQRLKAFYAQKEQEHLKEVDSINRGHSDDVNAINDKFNK